MKKLIVVAFAMALSLSGFAQALFWDSGKPEQKVVWGVRGGVNVSNIHISLDNLSVSMDSKVGYRFGISADFAIVNSLYINSGLYYSVKGAKGEGAYEDGSNVYDMSLSPAFIELPVYASYRVNLAPKSQIQVNFGPYFACGVNGKVKALGKKTNIFDDETGMRRFDAGLGVGAGYTYNHFYVGFDYQFGLANIGDTGGIGKITNRNFNFSIGYNF